ncbi:sigma-70 family RNA polymerase sigma factor [Rapidithrix thailandica]|uniref:Sigma-70 family RNA polymerase sigma factor n=1 Tax=Rapidithrix thailandica TaxID=413964 RepID=A0AAW9S738_9BACT
MSDKFEGHIAPPELVALLQARNKAAFNYLYDHYSGALYGVILRIVQKQDIAEEVLQDVFLKIWNKIDTYDSQKGRLFTWMLNVSRNLAIDKVRSKELRNERKTDEMENNVYSYEHKSQVHQSIDSIGIKEQLDKLREEERTVLEYVYFKGYTQSELSKEKQIPLGTVKTRLRMAIKNLRNVLGIS